VELRYNRMIGSFAEISFYHERVPRY